MYVDTVGKVTVGVGHNLSAHKDQQRLAFVVKRFERKPVLGGDKGTSILPIKRQLDRRASADEIQADFDFLQRNPGLGKFHASQSTMAAYTTLELTPAEVTRVFEADRDRAIRVAKAEFPDFDSYDVERQAALVDIAFNAGGFSTFRGNFCPAIKGEGNWAQKPDSERWEAAAAHSRRGAVDPGRNNQIANWLRARPKP
jgi:hypothetical protein